MPKKLRQVCDGRRSITVAGKDSDVIPGESGGWGAHSPDVDGVFAVGSTRGQVQQRMTEALGAHLEYLRDAGQPIPQPRTEPGFVAI